MTVRSGSEVTRVFVVADEDEKVKKPVYSDLVLADVGILDPLLTMSMPATLTAATGMDALANAIESYVSVQDTPFSDILSIEAIRLISREPACNLRQAGKCRGPFLLYQVVVRSIHQTIRE